MQQPERRRAYPFVEPAKPTDDVICQKQRQERDPHHGSVDADWRGPGDQRQQCGPVVEEGHAHSHAAERRPDWMDAGALAGNDGRYQDQVAGCGDPCANSDFGDFPGFTAMRRFEPPQPEKPRYGQNAHQPINGLKPRHRDSKGADGEIDMFLEPDLEHIV
jgi:hypothetical protein